MDADPVASMRCWPVEVELGGRMYDIPALPAAGWWPVLTGDGLNELLELLRRRPGDDQPIEDRIFEGEISTAELAETLNEVVEFASGRPAHAALVLAGFAAQHWPQTGGQLSRGGFRWDVMPLGAALDALYLTILEVLPEKSEDGKSNPRETFLKLLDNEIVTGGKPTGRAQQRAERDFASIAGPKPTEGVRATVARSGGARSKTRIRRPPRRPPDR